MLFGVQEAQERSEELMARAAAGEENRIARLVPIATAQKHSAGADVDSNIEDRR